jgi:hypothetical protein
MTRIDDEMKTGLPDDSGLEAFFAAARGAAPEPSAELLTRIMAGAEAELAARAAPPAAAPRRWRLANLVKTLGGWPALAGMATAAATGLWLGFAAPDSLNTLAGGLLLQDSTTATSYDYDFTDLVPGYSSSFSTLTSEESQG